MKMVQRGNSLVLFQIVHAVCSTAFMFNHETRWRLDSKQGIKFRHSNLFRLRSHSNFTYTVEKRESNEIEFNFVETMDQEIQDLQSLNTIVTLPPTGENECHDKSVFEVRKGMSYVTYEVDNFIIGQTIYQEPTDLQKVLNDNFPLPSVPQRTAFVSEPGFEEQKGISDVYKARLLLVCAAMLYGTNFSIVKLLGDAIPVGVNSALRFGLAALFSVPWLFQDVYKAENLGAAWLGFEVGLWNSIGYVSQAVGLETTAASTSAFICSLAVIVVPGIDYFTGKILRSQQLIGAMLAVIGVAFLELGSDFSSQLSSNDILSLIQPFAFGVGFWKMEKAMQKYPDQASRMTAAQLLAVFFATIAYGLYTMNLTDLTSLPWLEWLSTPSILMSIFWTGVVTTALTIYMENLALETLSAAETTLIFSTEPLWGTAFAAVVMGEQLGFNASVGSFLILIACIYSNLGLHGFLSLAKDLKIPNADLF